jgi:hypothetical protein
MEAEGPPEKLVTTYMTVPYPTPEANDPNAWSSLTSLTWLESQTWLFYLSAANTDELEQYGKGQ